MSLPSSPIVRLPAAAASVFGKYQLIAKLGQGGMAEVFLAAHRGPGGFEKLVVIKRLKQGVAADPETLDMFLDEARIAARLNHPNLVQTYECGAIDEEQYLAMEYLDGQPLDRVIHRLGEAGRIEGPANAESRPTLIELYLTIVSDALAGLHHAHELADFDGTPLKVVHRDVSPHNIFVTYAGQAKVVDFGIAKWTIRSAQTSTGVVKGKIAYMAPEQALSAPVDRRADIFAMGVILWEIAAGERLWGSLSEVQILQKMAFGELPRLRDRKPDAPEALQRICSRALAMTPADRYATAAEMREDVEALLAGLGRRPSALEMGQVVAEAFADRRAEAKAVIAEGHAGMAEEGLPVLDDRAGPPSVRGRSRSQRELSTGREATPSPAVASPPGALAESPGRRRWSAATALLGAAALGAGLLAALWRPESRPSADVQGSVSTQAPASADQRSALVELRIVATPAQARIFLDDVPVPSNPFTAKFPKDGTGHRIRVEADGYAPDARLVVFERDLAVEIGLLRADAVEVAPVSPAALRSGRLPAGEAPRRPTGEAAPPGTGAASASPPGVKVDTSDPWAASGPKPRP